MTEIIIGAVVLIAVIGTFVYIRFFRKSAPAVPQTQDQIDARNNPRK